MFFEVPQYIDIEDKIAFQLTAKQLGWFALGGVFIFLAWNFLEKGAFIFASIVIAGIASGMAFLRPYGMSLAAFISSGFFYFFRPKIYIWSKTRSDFSKTDSLAETVKNKKKSDGKIIQKKDLQINKIASLLDKSQGF